MKRKMRTRIARSAKHPSTDEIIVTVVPDRGLGLAFAIILIWAERLKSSDRMKHGETEKG
jgi:hypothetical protein